MKFQVIENLTVKTESREILLQAGQVIKLNPEKALKLINAGKVKPLTEVFEELFHNHMNWLSKHSLTADKIQKQNPELLQEMHSAIRDMDSSWLREDMKAFREAIEKVEALYMQALRRC